MARVIQHIRRFARDTRAAALVEFAVLLPVLVLMFGITIEGGRMFWAFQAANSGVRDAARYLARTTPRSICQTGGSVSGQATTLKYIVEKKLDGSAIFPSGITIQSVTPTLACVTGDFRVSPLPIAQVSATMTLTFPLSSMFALAGSAPATITTTIRDQTRVFGT